MSDIKSFQERDQWICAVLAARDQTPARKLVAVRLAMYLNIKTGRLNPGVETVARDLSRDIRNVHHDIDAIAAAGWIAIDPSRGGRSRGYHLTRPSNPVVSTGFNPVVSTGLEENQTLLSAQGKPCAEHRAALLSAQANNELTVEKNNEVYSRPNGREIKIESSRAPSGALENGFEEFWHAYPKKRKKADARAAYGKVLNWWPALWLTQPPEKARATSTPSTLQTGSRANAGMTNIVPFKRQGSGPTSKLPSKDSWEATMTDLVKTAPKAPAKANPSRVNVGALMDRCLAPFKIVNRFENEFALMKKHSRYAEDSFAFFDSRLKTKTPEQIAAARVALNEIIAGIDEKAAYEGFSELLEANKNTDERLIRGLIGVMLDVLAGKEAETNATYIDTMVWMISSEKYDGYQVPASAVAAAVRDTIASETFRPPISEFIKKVKTHHRTIRNNWYDMSELRMATGHAEECLEYLDDPTRWDEG